MTYRYSEWQFAAEVADLCTAETGVEHYVYLRDCCWMSCANGCRHWCPGPDSRHPVPQWAIGSVKRELTSGGNRIRSDESTSARPQPTSRISGVIRKPQLDAEEDAA